MRGHGIPALPEVGQRGGIFKRHGLVLEMLYTQGGPESIQAVISGSMDMAVGVGVSAALATYAKGAPIRLIGSEMIGSAGPLSGTSGPIRRSKRSRTSSTRRSDFRRTARRATPALLELLQQFSHKPSRWRLAACSRHSAIDVRTDRRRLGAAPFGLDPSRTARSASSRAAATSLHCSGRTARVNVAGLPMISQARAMHSALHARLSGDDRLDVCRSGSAQALRANIRDCPTRSCGRSAISFPRKPWRLTALWAWIRSSPTRNG